MAGLRVSLYQFEYMIENMAMSLLILDSLIKLAEGRINKRYMIYLEVHQSVLTILIFSIPKNFY